MTATAPPSDHHRTTAFLQQGHLLFAAGPPLCCSRATSFPLPDRRVLRCRPPSPPVTRSSRPREATGLDAERGGLMLNKKSVFGFVHERPIKEIQAMVSHSEVWSSSQPVIRNSSSSKRSYVSFGLLKRNHEEKPTILNYSYSKRSPVFGLLINHEEEAARKTQEEKLQEWRYNKRTAEMIAEYERDQEKEAKKSRPERNKWKTPVNKEATRSYLGSRSNGVKPSSPKKAVQKPQSKPVVETPSARTEEKRNYGFERWLTSFKAKIHQSITNPHPSSVLEEDQEAKDIEPKLSTVYEDDQLDDDFGPIFDEEEEPEAVSVLLAVQKVAEGVVDSGPEADLGKDLTTAYASGDILGSFSCDKLVQPFVCKEYDPVKLLRHDEGLIGLIHEVLDQDKLMGLMQNVEALCSIRNQCLDLSNKGPPRKYKPWSYSISI
ncbi:hypothetical protein F2Q69_00035184 [Brassica cretica]|uniref:Uncharacterized protein n=1 Tax=Brassica cretica TaxID=69181 RepID=A0A8S9SL75_BRACR|nr:hypothetical protein F2Q69_00035184 [Brassica cretica]